MKYSILMGDWGITEFRIFSRILLMICLYEELYDVWEREQFVEVCCNIICSSVLVHFLNARFIAVVSMI